MKRILLASLVLAAFASPAQAAVLDSELEIKPLTEEIMQTVSKGKLREAFEMMKPFMIIPEPEIESTVLSSISTRDQFGSRYGATIGYELISERKLGDSLVLLTYIEKTEKHVLPWYFYFYNSPEGWVLNSFSWNDDLSLLFLY
ncbi:MAG: hypothetical protein JW937_02375 [Candidatus Omnitrophica bacterium]|nr:hypothetical protein [Candidatus Omnitrophota bacterium]